MLLDLPHLMLQAGHRVLPKPKLREGWVAPPRAMDGIPAPVSSLVNKNIETTRRSHQTMSLLSDWMEKSTDSYRCEGVWKKDMIWYGPVGIGMATNCEEYHKHFLIPLHSAFTDSSLEIDVFSCEGPYCGVHGRFSATHTGEWLGAKPTGKRINLRFGMHYHVDVVAHDIGESWAIFDLPDVFNQMGINLWDRMKQVTDDDDVM
eukprot:jgi/Bigna1/133827/aug1.22_g8535